MRKLKNDGIFPSDETGLEDDGYDSLKDGVEDDKIDLGSFSDDEEADQY